VKLGLILSLLLNLVLVGLLLRQYQQPPLERTIIEQHHSDPEVRPQPKAREHSAAVPRKSRPSAEVSPELGHDIPVRPTTTHEMEEMRLQHEKMQQDRQEYLSSRLELSPRQIESLEALKQRFHEETNQLYQQSSLTGEMSFADRRRLLELEEKLHQDLARTMGEKKWEQFRKFRQNYNKKLIDAQGHSGSEPTPVLLMEL
jgi:hypothetical protein